MGETVKVELPNDGVGLTTDYDSAVGLADLMSPTDSPSCRPGLKADPKAAVDLQSAGAMDEFKSGKKQLFVNQEKMKEQLRERMAKPAYDVTNFYHKTGRAQKIARSTVFEVSTLAVIALNALWISIDTDMNHAETLIDADWPFIVAENLFCAYFFGEWLIRYLSFKRKRNGLRDAWFVFDSSLVFLMVVETWVMTSVSLILGGSSSGGLGNASILRMARLLRLTRMARMARLLRSMPELMILVRGMVAATRSVVFTLLLLMVFLYVFAIAFRQLSAKTDIGDEFFSSVPESMHTLLIHGTFLDDLATVAHSLSAQAPALLPLWYIYVLLAAMTLMNMLIGVLCEVVTAVASTEKEAMTIAYVRDVLHEILTKQNLDTNQDGQISKDEFMNLFEDKTAMSLLEDIGVDVLGLMGFADFIFTGQDQEEVTLGYDDLLKLILDIRGSNGATVKDVVDLRRFVSDQFTDMKHLMESQRTENGAGRRDPSKSLSDIHRGDKNSPAPPDIAARAKPYVDRGLPSDIEAFLEGASRASSKASSIPELNLEALKYGTKRPDAIDTGNLSSGQVRKEVTLEAVIAPIALNFKRLTKELVEGVQVLQQHDHAFAEMRTENRRLLNEALARAPDRLATIPGTPNEGSDDSPFFQRSPKNILISDLTL